MNKSKYFVVLAVLALLIASLCACNSTKPSENETNQEQTVVSTAANNAGNEDNTNSVKETETSAEVVTVGEDEDLLTQGENDLEIMTVPQDGTDAPQNTEGEAEVTEAVAETTASKDAEKPTEAEKIELPFVPAN